MVTIIPNGKSVSLEATIKITEGMANVVKSQKEEMDKIAKTFDFEYFLATDENGVHTMRIVSNGHKKLLTDEVERFEKIEAHLVQIIEDLITPDKKELPQEEQDDMADKVHELIGDNMPYMLIYVQGDGVSMSGTMRPQHALELLLDRLANS